MTKEKKLLITTILLWAMLPISAFGLSLITEAFLIVGIYCGFSAVLCGNIYMDLKIGKKLNLIPIGFFMTLFGVIFLAVSDDFFPLVCIPLSTLYAAVGLITLMKGIKNWHVAKHDQASREKIDGEKHCSECEVVSGRDIKKEILPVFYPDLEAYQMDMHTASGEKYRFILTGLRLYHPNMSSRCGYGSDEWFFLCKYNSEDCILRFSDDAGYGTMWDCAVISTEDARQIHSLPDLEWLTLMHKSKITTCHLHPDSIDSAKEIVKKTCSRTGTISDESFYGY